MLLANTAVETLVFLQQCSIIQSVSVEKVGTVGGVASDSIFLVVAMSQFVTVV